MTDSDNPRRVLLKLSGEAFGGGKVGIDTQVIRRIAEEIVPAVQQGVQVAIVVGGGNFFRGAELQQAYRSFPWRLHGYARHGDELPRSTGLSGAGGAGHPRADRHHHGTGRRAVYSAQGHPSP